jgi:hypothetical protein
MLDLPTVIAGHQWKSYVHSWCDVCSLTSLEAKRVITSFILDAYRAVDKSPWSVRPDVWWAKSFFTTGRPAKNLNSLQHSIHIFHYIGLGFPPPEAHRIWLKDPSYSMGTATSLTEIKQILSPPCLLVFDCDKAAILKTFLMSQQPGTPFDTETWRMFFVMFACSQTEQLHIEVELPQNFFSCILLSPMRAFSRLMHVPIPEGDSTTTTFNSLLDLFSETIALDSLEPDVFYRLFRGNPRISSLWRRFLLAQRLMKQFGLHCESIPELPDMSEHQLWQHFEYAVMRMDKANMIAEFSELYQSHFVRVPNPARYVCAFLASLSSISSERTEVLAKIAHFMRQSPENCHAMGELMSVKHLGDYVTVSRCGSPINFQNWCTVVSGFLLAVPAFAKTISVSVPEAMKAVMDPGISDEIRVLLMSILVSIKEAQVKIPCPLHTETTDQLSPQLFHSSPLVREWTALLIHAGIALYQTEPRYTGPTWLHVRAMLLLYDNRKFTRAAGIAILTSLMAPECHEFNLTIVHLALKAAVDGAALVRLSLAHLISRYLRLSTGDPPPERSELPLDWFIRKDAHEFMAQAIVSPPPLRQVLRAFSNDPSNEVRELADGLLEDPAREKDLSAEHARLVHRTAHAALFSKAALDVTMPPRYGAELFRIGEIECLEKTRQYDAEVSALVFSLDHGSVAFGNADGRVCWGDDEWRIGKGRITSIVPLPGLALAVASDDGCVYIVRHDIETTLEAFRPGITKAEARITMAAVPGSSIAFIAHGGVEILVWDVAALLLIHRILVSTVVTQFGVVGNKLFCALENGVIHRIHPETYQIEATFGVAGESIVRMGDHRGQLYTVSNRGIVRLWNDGGSVVFREAENGVVDCLLHPTLSGRVVVKNDAILLDEARFDGGGTVCCCMDGNRPLLAIGGADGSVAVWWLALR